MPTFVSRPGHVSSRARRISRLRWREGGPRVALCTAVSVTSITARLPRAAESLLLHRQMIESLPSAVFVCDARTATIVEHNAAASRFFGELARRRPASLIGCDARDCFPDFEATLGPL